MYIILIIFLSIQLSLSETWFDRIAERMKVGVSRRPFEDIIPILGKFSENTTLCMKHCQKYYKKSLSQYIRDPIDFGHFPFVNELVNNETNMALFCNHFQLEMNNCLSNCGLIHPEQYQPLPHNFICDKYDEMKHLPSCLFSGSTDNCLKNCSKTMRESANDTDDAQKCTAFKCVQSCISDCDQETVNFVHKYFSFVAEKLLILYKNATTFPSECQTLLPFPFYLPETQEAKTEQICKPGLLSNTTCKCVFGQRQFNLDCIRNCYLPCIYQNDPSFQWNIVNQGYSCNINECSKDIGSALFNEETVLSRWFDVELVNGHTYKVTMKELAAQQFGLYSNAPFNVGILLSTFRWWRTGDSGETPRGSCSVERSNLLPLMSYGDKSKTHGWKQRYKRHFPDDKWLLQGASRLTKSKRELYLYRPNNPMTFHLRFEIAGQIFWMAPFAPERIKKMYPERRPRPIGGPGGHVTTKAVMYSQYKAELIVKWRCPFMWNAQPLLYEVHCLIVDSSRHKEETDEYQNFGCQRRTPNCNKLWNIFIGISDQVMSKSIDWHQHKTSFLISFSSVQQYKNLRSYCRIRAHNSNGPGQWSAISFASFESQETFSLPKLLVEQKINNFTWTYHVLTTSKNLLFGELGEYAEWPFHQILGQRHNETKYLNAEGGILPAGYYDWLGDRWFATVEYGLERELFIATIEVDQAVKKIERLFKVDGIPYQMLFLPVTSTLIWTEQLNGNTTLKRADISQRTISPQTLGLKDFNCSACRDLGSQLVSAAITPAPGGNVDVENIEERLSPELSILVQTDNGLWKVWLDHCHCKQIMPSEHITVKIKSMVAIVEEGNEMDDIQKSVNLLVIPENQTLYNTITYSTAAFLYLHDSWNYIEGMLTGRIRRPNFLAQTIIENAKFNQLEYLPAYPAYIVNFTKLTAERILAVPQVQYALPEECLFPNVTVKTATMRSTHTAELELVVHWSSSNKCSKLSKPKLIYQVKYRITTEKEETQNCHVTDCPCYQQAACRRWGSGEVINRFSFLLTLVDLQPDQNYLIEAFATPSLGNFRQLWFEDRVQPWTSLSSFYTDYRDPNLVTRDTLLGTLIPLTVILIALGLLFYYWYQKKWYVYQQIQRITAEQIKIKPEDRDNPLGKGEFGAVYKATMSLKGTYWCGIYFPTNKSFSAPVAVKMLLPTCNLHDEMAFRDEAILLSKLSHENIIKTMGICMDSRPIMLALEFLDGGSLESYLHKAEIQQQITAEDLYFISIDILQACCHMQDRHVIHRDLSAKNCLVELQRLNGKPYKVKLSDFGLAKDLGMNVDYSSRKLQVFPIAYTAPEGFENKFSSKSDVWSYGVVLWEIWSWASIPFIGCYADDNHMCTMQPFSDTAQIQRYVCVEQHSLADWQSPCHAPFSFNDVANYGPLENIMKLCWEFQPTNRPNFIELLNHMKESKSLITRITIVAPPSQREENIIEHQPSLEPTNVDATEECRTNGSIVQPPIVKADRNGRGSIDFPMDLMRNPYGEGTSNSVVLQHDQNPESISGSPQVENSILQKDPYNKISSSRLGQHDPTMFLEDPNGQTILGSGQHENLALFSEDSKCRGCGKHEDPTPQLEEASGQIFSGFIHQSNHQAQSSAQVSCDQQEAAANQNVNDDNKEICETENPNSEVVKFDWPEHSEFIELEFFNK